jgi:hypothetical protein
MEDEKRKLTIEIEITEPDSDWLWDTMKKEVAINGVQAFSVSDGWMGSEIHEALCWVHNSRIEKNIEDEF